MKKWIRNIQEFNHLPNNLKECPENIRIKVVQMNGDIDKLIIEIEQLEKMLIEALNEWQYSSKYKNDYLQSKHKDLERIAEIREILKGKMK